MTRDGAKDRFYTVVQLISRGLAKEIFFTRVQLLQYKTLQIFVTEVLSTIDFLKTVKMSPSQREALYG